MLDFNYINAIFVAFMFIELQEWNWFTALIITTKTE